MSDTPLSPTLAAAFQQALQMHRQGGLRDALAAYDAILAVAPRHAPALHYSGVVLLEQGHAAEAASRIRRAVETDPADVDAWSNLALAYQATGRHDAAVVALEEATRRAPRDGQLLANLAGVLLDAGKPAHAERAARRAVDANPTVQAGWFNLALALQASDRLPEALTALRRGAALAPTAPAFVGLEAQLQERLGSPDAARATLEKALTRDPGALPLRFQLAELLERQGDVAGAANAYAAIVRVEPRHGAALSQLLFLRKQIADWHDLDQLRAAFRAGVQARLPTLSPFCLLSDPSSRAEQRRCAETWTASMAPPPPVGPKAAPRIDVGHPRLRIGYLSADFHSHATAFLAAGVFEQHDRSRFEITGYSTGPDDGSPMRGRLDAAFGGLVDAFGWSADRLASRVRADRIDILVDLKGHTRAAPMSVLAQRPAPVQVHWLGYPGTTGAPYVDYLIGDAIVTPFEHADDYTETLVHLPYSYQPNDRARPIAESQPREALGLPADAVVYCCFNNAYKLNPEVLDAYARIAAAVPASVFWFMARESGDPAKENLLREAARRGIEPGRVVFATNRSNPEYLALYRCADVFLDTWPYNGHTTVSDALWASCPVVALLGETFAGRVAASLLTAVGLADLIAGNVDEYVKRAFALGSDAGRRADLRAYLDGMGHQSRLFDTVATTRALEAAYVEMAAQHRAGTRSPFRIVAPVAGEQRAVCAAHAQRVT